MRNHAKKRKKRESQESIVERTRSKWLQSLFFLSISQRHCRAVPMVLQFKVVSLVHCALCCNIKFRYEGTTVLIQYQRYCTSSVPGAERYQSASGTGEASHVEGACATGALYRTVHIQHSTVEQATDREQHVLGALCTARVSGDFSTCAEHASLFASRPHYLRQNQSDGLNFATS